jgi:methyltransferase (TIGR00027 family)
MEALPEVSLTAIGVAAARAAETARADRLFSDPYAAGFVRAADEVSASVRDPGHRREGLATWVSVRTRFLDDLLLDACASGTRQVVILGAGLDARGFRLSWPEGLRLYELDLPGVLEFKQAVIAAEAWSPACERVSVPVDLSEDWSRPLLKAGFEASRSVAWIAEGLLAYLSPPTSDALVGRAAELSPRHSRFGLSLASARRLRHWRETHLDNTVDPHDYVSLWRTANAEQAVEWLALHHWRARTFEVAERAASYGRVLEQKVPSEPGRAGELEASTASPRRSGARLVDAERV